MRPSTAVGACAAGPGGGFAPQPSAPVEPGHNQLWACWGLGSARAPPDCEDRHCCDPLPMTMAVVQLKARRAGAWYAAVARTGRLPVRRAPQAPVGSPGMTSSAKAAGSTVHASSVIPIFMGISIVQRIKETAAMLVASAAPRMNGRSSMVLPAAHLMESSPEDGAVPPSCVIAALGDKRVPAKAVAMCRV